MAKDTRGHTRRGRGSLLDTQSYRRPQILGRNWLEQLISPKPPNDLRMQGPAAVLGVSPPHDRGEPCLVRLLASDSSQVRCRAGAAGMVPGGGRSLGDTHMAELHGRRKESCPSLPSLPFPSCRCCWWWLEAESFPKLCPTRSPCLFIGHATHLDSLLGQIGMVEERIHAPSLPSGSQQQVRTNWFRFMTEGDQKKTRKTKLKWKRKEKHLAPFETAFTPSQPPCRQVKARFSASPGRQPDDRPPATKRKEGSDRSEQLVIGRG